MRASTVRDDLLCHHPALCKPQQDLNIVDNVVAWSD
jgi:hypothetical protein